jgi:septal ring factor EnvC (AmiA/AmiB activator)
VPNGGLTWLVSQTEGPTSFVPDLVQQGALAAVLIALLLGQLLTKPSVDQERKLANEALARMDARIDEANARAAKAEQQRDALLEQLTSALPAMREATEAAISAAEASKHMTDAVQDAIDRFEREVRLDREMRRDRR